MSTEYEINRAQLSNAIDQSTEIGSRETNAISRIATFLLQTIATGNGEAFTLTGYMGKEKVDVEISPETIEHFARGVMPSKAADCIDGEVTRTTYKQAIASLSERYVSNAKAAADAGKVKGSHTAVQKARAKQQKATAAYRAAEKSVERAIQLAAYVIGCEDDGATAFDWYTAHEGEDGALFVTRADCGNETVQDVCTYADARKWLTSLKSDGTPRTSKENQPTGKDVSLKEMLAGVKPQTVSAKQMPIALASIAATLNERGTELAQDETTRGYMVSALRQIIASLGADVVGDALEYGFDDEGNIARPTEEDAA